MVVAAEARVRHSTETGPHPDEREGLLQRYGQLVATAACGGLLLAGLVGGALDVVGERLQVALYAGAYLAGGVRATRQAIGGLLRRTVDVDLLMVLAAAGAAVIGHWLEGGVLLFLFSLSNTLEHYAMDRTYNAIRALMDLRPDEALVERDGATVRVNVDDLLIGDVLVVLPGERIAADGEIIAGESGIDESTLTGEALPVSKGVGDQVFTGSINGRGALRVRVGRLASESTLAKIIEIVRQAQAEKSATQRFTDRFEGWYAGGVIAAAGLYGLLPALFLNRPFNESFYQSMILLVVASPCALVISTPASTLSALANAARHGVLFKGARHLEDLGVVSVVAFDKTGTLTAGKPKVTDCIPLPNGDHSSDQLLALTAAIERYSEHPLAQAVVNEALAGNLVIPEAENVVAHTGSGVAARVAEAHILVGSERMFAGRDWAGFDALQPIAARLRDDGKTIMYVGREDASGHQMLGVIAVADTLRPVAPKVLADLKRLGISRTVILTGDNERAARAIARRAGIDDVRSGLLPGQKLEEVHRLRAEFGGVVMVGDGVNDAPALAAATVGVAMGSAGADVALETADVVLMSDDLTRLPYAVSLSRATRRIIRQNLTFSLSVITVLVIGTLFGITTLSLGVVGHEGSTVVVVLNGLRLLDFRPPLSNC
ncbi:MAG: cadmium-translocating P-type ATPase [Chloroflexi bacterium]|nr:MAG: cadmium-translocating P-type ATPase [Chloroflexota bacterium]